MIRFLAIALIATTSLITPVKAAATVSPQTSAQEPTKQQVANACIQNRADTLPVPFSDVSPNDWAFIAVMTMHYCGAFRQATPPALFQTPLQKQQTPQHINQS